MFSCYKSPTANPPVFHSRFTHGCWSWLAALGGADPRYLFNWCYEKSWLSGTGLCPHNLISQIPHADPLLGKKKKKKATTKLHQKGCSKLLRTLLSSSKIPLTSGCLNRQIEGTMGTQIGALWDRSFPSRSDETRAGRTECFPLPCWLCSEDTKVTSDSRPPVCYLHLHFRSNYYQKINK